MRRTIGRAAAAAVVAPARRWARSLGSTQAARAFAVVAAAARPIASAGAASSPQSSSAASSRPVDPAASHSPSPSSPPNTGQEKHPTSLLRVMLLSALTAGALYSIKLAWDIEHEEDVTVAVDRWIEQRAAAAADLSLPPLLPPAAPPSRLASLLSRSGRSIYATSAAEESVGDARLLSALGSVHPSLPRMERVTRRLIVWPGLNFFSRMDLCKMYAEQESGGDAASTAQLHQQCLSTLNNPSRRRRHERNALELLGVARVLEELAGEYERPDEIRAVAQCRFKEAATLLRALIKHSREALGPKAAPDASNPSSSSASPAAAASAAPVPMHLHLGLISALLGAREFGAAMAELDTAQQTINTTEQTTPPETKAQAQRKIAQVKSAIEKAKSTQRT